MSEIVRSSVRGREVLMRCGSPMERFRIDTYEVKEPETLDWIDEHFTAGDTLYDIGANVGVYSLYAALRNPRGQVFGFEASVRNCAALLENAALNRLTNLTACCFPIAAGRAFGWFHLSGIQVGSSMHSFGGEAPLAEFGERTVLRQGCVSTSLDTLLEDGFPPPSLIKIDVDGLEADILAGARQTLERPTLRSVLVELNWSGMAPARAGVELVKAAGFRLVNVGNVTQRARMRWQNYIFVRR